MCVVSMVCDHYRDMWTPKYVPHTVPFSVGSVGPAFDSITRQEFDDLKRQVMEMKELLRRAKEYDELNNEPDCEVDEKMELLRRIAGAVGVSLDDVIKPKA